MTEPVPPGAQAFVDQVSAQVRENRLDAPQAAAERRCAAPPTGCGQPLPEHIPFLDDVSRREYEITRLCQRCQDRMFAPTPGEMAELDEDPSYERCGECGEYRPLQFVDTGVGVMSGHNCCADIRFGDAPRPPRCERTSGCVFAVDHVHHCETP